jgi:FAD-dependent urate hydroxylase
LLLPVGAANAAATLRDTDSAESAFALYEHLRRERVERIVALGKKTGDVKTPNTLARVVRDLALRWNFRRSRASGDDPFKWIFDYRVEWEDRLVKL